MVIIMFMITIVAVFLLGCILGYNIRIIHIDEENNLYKDYIEALEKEDKNINNKQ